MNYIGKKVRHRKFGEGIIIEQNATLITVKFSSILGTKNFLYPSCFNPYLKLLDTDLAAQIEDSLKRQEQLEKKKMQAKRKREQELRNEERKTTIEHFFSKYINALKEEVSCLKNCGGKKQYLSNGKRIDHKNGRYIYTFETDDELHYPNGTQISIWQKQGLIHGNIVGYEDFTLVIESSVDLGTDIPELEFSAEPWQLLTALIERLSTIQQYPSKIVSALICDGVNAKEYNVSTLTSGQKKAVTMSSTQPITFIWGPPGTGKTQTLADIALTHIEQGDRVLMLSYSNVSVDGAIMRIHKISPHTKPGTFVRYGYAQMRDLLEHEYLTSYNLVIRDYPELLKARQNLISERKNLPKHSARFAEISDKLARIRNKLALKEKEAVNNASFVATTVSKAVVDKTIYGSQFDIVLFDEASMAYIPQIIFSASLTRKFFVCIGDFRQLPPIVQNNAVSPLNRDIFQYCGISDVIDRNINHKWLCMLDTQYRMHPNIAGFASRTMYRCLLRSAADIEENRQLITNRSPAAGYALAFADLSGMMSVCSKTIDGSRVNVLSAFISFSLALEAAPHQEVGIITPYHAQSRLLHAMARDITEVNPNLKPISCATVHQFQGSEKDIIIYDVVDCYRLLYPGLLLCSSDNDLANRLFNVALTRARGKFIGVANIDYMDNKRLSERLMFKQMIDMQRNTPGCLSGSELTRQRQFISGSPMSFFNYTEETKLHFLHDIETARKEIRIDIPDKLKDDDDFAKHLTIMLDAAKKRNISVFLRTENKQLLPYSLKPLAIENTFIVNPIVLIDKKIVWFGMPASDANFRADGGTIITKYHPIIRFEGANTAKSLYRFLKMSETIDQSNAIFVNNNGSAVIENFANFVLAHEQCPTCGKPMKLHKNKAGIFFLGCTGYPDCNVTSQVSVELIKQYIHRNGAVEQRCAVCNNPLEIKSGRFGLYVQCFGHKHHKFRLDEI